MNTFCYRITSAYIYRLLLASFFFYSSAQVILADNLDSLRHNAVVESDNYKKTDNLNQLAEIHRDTSILATFEYADEAYAVAAKLNYKLGMSQSLYHRSYALAMNNDFEDALSLIKEALKIHESNDKFIKPRADYLKLNGWILFHLSDYFKSMQLFNQSYDLYFSIDDNLGMAKTLLNMGAVYSSLGDKETALKYYQDAYELNQLVNDDFLEVYCLNNIASMYAYKGLHSDALKLYQEASNLSEKASFLRFQSRILRNIADSFLSLCDYVQAEKYYSKANEINIKTNDNLEIARNKIKLIKLNSTALGTKSNLIILHDAYSTAVKYDYVPLQVECTHELSVMHEKLGDYKAALKFLRISSELQDSIANSEIRGKVEIVRAKRQYNLQKNKFEKKTEELVLREKLNHKSRIQNFLIVFILVLTTLGSFLYFSNKRTIRLKNDLTYQNELLQNYVDLNVELEHFAAIASHDIKAPLRTISSYIGLLKKKFYDLGSLREKQHFDIIEKSSKSLHALIDNLLVFTKSRKNKINTQLLDLNIIINEVLDTLKYSISEAGAKVDLNLVDTMILADQSRLKQILQNLISNCIKFRDKERTMILTINSWRENDFYFISIRDNGIGIDEENLEVVLEQFKKLHSEDEYQGSGLGLSIVKNYVSLHGGDIALSRNKDFGVTTTFTLKQDISM